MADDKPVCPFSDPKFELDLDTPCPVCGQTGTWHDNDFEHESKCVD